MFFGCITCLVVAVVLCTDCFPNPPKAKLGANRESGLFPRESGRFCKFRHVLNLHSYELIFMERVTSYDVLRYLIVLMVPVFMFRRFRACSSCVDFSLSRR